MNKTHHIFFAIVIVINSFLFLLIMEIREFTESDAERLSELIKTTLTEITSQDTPQFAINQLLEVYTAEGLINRPKTRKLYVAEAEGLIIGSVGIEENNITTLFVDHRFLKNGVGTDLLEFAEKKVSLNNYSHVKLTSSLGAIGFFEKKGYQKTSDVVLEGQTVSYNVIKAY